MTEIIKSNNGNVIVVNGKPYASILSVEGASDSFQKLEDGAGSGTDTPKRQLTI